MKYFLKFTAISLLLFFVSCVPPQQEPPNYEDDDSGASYQEFYDGLSPYGHWVHHPSSGYVWIPEAGPDFVPYSTDGYWVWSDQYGWVWVSDYRWGWAPFHYGRWDNDDEFGWYWVPDLTWGPAWVAWRQCPGYYGWAPMRPGISIDIVFGGRYMPPEYWWTGCEGRYFGRREMHDHYDRGGDRNHGGERVGRIFGGESRAVGNAPNVGGGKRGLVTGPPVKEIEAVSHSTIPSVKVSRSNTPGESLNGNTLNIYRPQLPKNTAPRTQSGQNSTQQAPAARSAEPKENSTPQNVSTPNTSTAPRNSNPPSSQPAPRSVTTMPDVRELRRQAQPPATRKDATPEQRKYYESPKQNTPAPRQEAPKQAPAPRQQPAPRQSAPREDGSQGKRN